MLSSAEEKLQNFSLGSIIINGKTLHKEISFPDHMGLIIENMELQPQLTAFENLEELNKINHYATTSDIQDALRKINLQSNEKVKKFSLGMKQKLNIAQAIFENPRLLLLDEPTNALDSDAIEHLKAILEDLKKKNSCIIIATHDHQNITSLCDQILEMKEGNLYDKN
jgi:ABC-2 type transport system ATP-binding protein